MNLISNISTKAKDYWKSFYFSIRTIGSDLLSLKWYEFIFISLSGAFVSIMQLYNSKIDAWIWEDNFHWTAGSEVFEILAGLTAWMGIVSVFLNGKGKSSNFIFALVNNLLFGLFAFSSAYTSNAILSIFIFFPLEFVGIYIWCKYNGRDKKNNAVNPRSIKLSRLLIVYSLIFVSTFLFSWFAIPPIDEWWHNSVLNYSGFNYPLYNDVVLRTLSTLVFSLSSVAIVMTVFARKKQWYVWIVVNALQIAMFAGVVQTNYLMIIMWSVYLLNSIYALFQWHIRAKKSKAAEAVTKESSATEA